MIALNEDCKACISYGVLLQCEVDPIRFWTFFQWGCGLSFRIFQRLFTDNFTVRIRCFDVSFYFTAIHCPILLEPSHRVKPSSVRCFRYCCAVARDFPIVSAKSCLVYLFPVRIKRKSSFSAPERPCIESFIGSFIKPIEPINDAINSNMRKGCSWCEPP